MRRLIVCTFVFAMVTWPALSVQAQGPRERREARERGERAAEALAATVRADIERILNTLDDEGDLEVAEAELGRLFRVVLAYGSMEDPEAFEDAAFAMRLVRQSRQSDGALTPALWAFLREHDALARAVVFGLDEEHDDIKRAYALLARLVEAHGEAVAKLPQLTAAVCMVHDRDLVEHVNENTVTAADPKLIWAFYARHANRMVFDLDSTPPQLLVYVVNNAAPIEEMEWAMKRYAGDRRVGNRYHDVAYDYNHMQTGAPKLVTERGYSLPNIKQYGGICADQAYFAGTIGKSIGVPTVEATARGPDMGHAWIGYLEQRNRRAWWNFDEGCWDDYKKLIGRTRDPQTRERRSEGDVSILAQLFGVPIQKIQRAAALTEAGRLLAQLEMEDGDYPPPPPDGIEPDLIEALGYGRPATLDTRLALAEAALRQCQGYVPAWEVVRESATHPDLSFEQKQEWTDLLDRLCGNNYPAFMVSFMAPMIESIEDPSDQLKMWERLHRRVAREPELAARVCMSLGAQWEQAGEKAKAYECYRVVVMNYTNDGLFVLEAVEACERMLNDAKRPDVLARLLEDAWRRCQRPSSNSPMATGSVWSRMGLRAAKALDAAGRGSKAQSIRNQIKSLEDRASK